MNLGKYSYTGRNINVLFENDASYVIGKFSSIASDLTICLGGNHRHDWVTTYPFGHTQHNVFTTYNGTGHPRTKGDVIIGNDVWIGDNVTIMSGVTIGDGAVLARNSHVVKNVEPYTLVGGNPAKLIKYRFEKEQIDKLLEIKWWDWEEEKINRVAPLLCNTNIDAFIQSALSENKAPENPN
jgi:acetyltransferase-like isoleucine patch superfamily enzyme